MRRAELLVLRRLLHTKFVWNLSATAGCSLVSRVCTLLIVALAARRLGPTSFGLVGLGVSIAAYAGILLAPGFSTWGYREIAQQCRKPGEVLTVVNSTQFVLALIAYAAIAVVALTRGDPEAAKVFLLSGLLVFDTALAVDFVFAGLELNRVYALFNAIANVCGLIALLVFIHTEKDIYFYAALTPASTGLAVACEYAYLHGRLRIRWLWPGFAQLRIALRSSLALGGLATAVTLLQYATNFIVEGYLGTKALGLFTSVFYLLVIATAATRIFQAVFLPRLSRQATVSPERAREEAALVAEAHVAVALPLAALFAVEAPAIERVLLGPVYLATVPLFRLLGVAIFFNFVICGYTNCLIPYRKDKALFLLITGSLLACVGGGFLLVPAWGLLGAMVAVCLSDATGWLASLPLYRRVFGSFHLRRWIGPCLGATVVVAMAQFLMAAHVGPWVRWPAEIIIGGLLAGWPLARRVLRQDWGVYGLGAGAG